MLQKKVCLLGAFAAGKTSLMRQFVHSVFSEKYHTTVGVKIDRKRVDVGNQTMNMLIWDMAGEDDFQEVRPTYLRGAAGLIFVVDGTRAATLSTITSLRELAAATVGAVPTVVTLNKVDLAHRWELPDDTQAELEAHGERVFLTSAKTGAGVAEAFQWLAEAMVRPA